MRGGDLAGRDSPIAVHPSIARSIDVNSGLPCGAGEKPSSSTVCSVIGQRCSAIAARAQAHAFRACGKANRLTAHNGMTYRVRLRWIGLDQPFQRGAPISATLTK